ncbi:MAG: alpha/beta fold hydrolase, partial [Pseudomonadota bacterium]|nr:alpha/beta fold hydrolase [Pseudomonadota bacterium]
MIHFWNFLRTLPISHEQSERHRPYPPDSSLQAQAGSIEAYLDVCRRRVEAARTDLDEKRAAWIVEGNSPFVFKPDSKDKPRRGILMVHGLSDSPFMMRDLARFFQQQGFYVLAMQLPGHGTRPGDLLEVRWQDWAGAHQRLLELLTAEVDDVYLLGFSAGATLSLYQSMRNSSIKGLFLFAPALRISAMAQLAGPLSYFGKWWQRFSWFELQPDSDYFKYESLANRAIGEVYEMIKAVERLATLVERHLPVFVAASENDVAVDSRAILDWFSRQQGLPKRMLYYSTGHPQLPEKVKLVPAHLPDQNIKSFSHTALMQSPSNPHYGKQGEHCFCTHYYHLD